ncbi:hypothetical protein KW782_02015 [Candidatus Parcubacteria bacterium]|nr:hypothetical protein [Candidatus Parcubacteria bacterium]
MKISKALPQFEEEPSLFVVTGKQDAAFYKAYDGTIEQIGEIKIPTPHYSDREGHYRMKAGGAVPSTGGYERRDDVVIRDFIHELKSHLKSMHASDYSKMYVFTPSKVKNTIAEAVPGHLRRKTAAVIEGNYFKSSPLELLQKVASITAASQIFINPEARRILDRSRQARRRIRSHSKD